jgi:arsenite methyltransferase
MNETTERVARHYGANGIADRVLKALTEKGQPVDRLTPEMLYPFDQLHARQLAGTKDHLARLKLQPSQHLLDVGSGLGGPARYAAATFGSRVTGIDVTEGFVVAARELTERCGLADRVEFLHADALSMPFDDASFDVASCHYVAMNIADKVGLLREIRRVLKPGGRLAWGVVVKGSSGDPHYPVPWSRDPSTSFLVTRDELRAAFEAADLHIVEWTDETDLLRDTRGSDPQANVGTPPAARAAVSLGEDFPERFRNFGRNLAEGRVGSVSVAAERS